MIKWSHYASQHKGICIGFDTNILIGKCKKNDHSHPVIHSLKNVIYINQRPCERNVDMFFKKFDEWSYKDNIR
ncbi:MAG: DUF2971 domain-containing protein [Francisella endosymbiont of Hyalomma asiaticum]